MRYFLILLTVISFTLLSKVKPVPPGTSMTEAPNVLFVIDDSGSMSTCVGGGYLYWVNGQYKCCRWVYNQGLVCYDDRKTRMQTTKDALNKLLENEDLVSSMRMGLSDFPNSYEYGYGYLDEQFLVPIKDTDSQHIQNLKSKIALLTASGGTPLTQALINSEKYYRGGLNENNYNDYVRTSGTSAIDWISPVNDICQKNYVVLFTDGAANGGQNPVKAQAKRMSTPEDGCGLDGIQVQGQDMADKKILTYGIGFGGVNVDYIAKAGGTEHGYQANNEAQLLDVFTTILKDIQSRNTVATSPTIVPNYTDDSEDIMYATGFTARRGKQWVGKLFKYKMNENGSMKEIWEFSEKLKSMNSRNIITNCNGFSSNNGSKNIPFEVTNKDKLATCMFKDEGGGFVELCEVGDWHVSSYSCGSWKDNGDHCIPKRQAGSDKYANNIKVEDRHSISVSTPNNEDEMVLSWKNLFDFNSTGNNKLLSNYILSDYILVDIEEGKDSGTKIIVSKVGDAPLYLQVDSENVSYTSTGSLKVKDYKKLTISSNMILKAKKVNINFVSGPNFNSVGPKLNKTYKSRNSKVCVQIDPQEQSAPTAFLEKTTRLINFFRGNDSYQDDSVLTAQELNNCKTNANCKPKDKMLADIYNSRVKYVGKPNQFYTYKSYVNFKKEHKNDRNILLVGSNSGLLHAIDPESGNELWAYVPPNLLSALKSIDPESERKGSVSRFFVDSTPKVMDVCKGECLSKNDWKTIMLVSFGEGREGLMALDLTGDKRTNPEFLWGVLNLTPSIYKNKNKKFIGCENVKVVAYWTKDGSVVMSNDGNGNILNNNANHELLDLNGEYDYSNLSKTWSEPVIAQLGGSKKNTGKFVAVFGGGGVEEKRIKTENTCAPSMPNKDVFGSSVYFVDVFTGAIVKRYDLLNTDTSVSRVPSVVTILPEGKNSGTNNRIIKNVYFGDLSGNVWRIQPSLNNDDIVSECNRGNSDCKKIYAFNHGNGEDKMFYKGVSLSFTGKPSDENKKLWTFWGTGSSSIYNLPKIYDNKRAYLGAVVDTGWKDNSDNTNSVILDFTGGSCENLDKKIEGWVYKLRKGEKLIAKPSVIDGYVYYVTYIPDNVAGDVCMSPTGTSYLYSFKIRENCSESNEGEVNALELGEGIATAPVVRGEHIYIAVSGKISTSLPEDEFSNPANSIVKWKRKSNTSTLNSRVKFSFFRELY